MRSSHCMFLKQHLQRIVVTLRADIINFNRSACHILKTQNWICVAFTSCLSASIHKNLTKMRRYKIDSLSLLGKLEAHFCHGIKKKNVIMTSLAFFLRILNLYLIFWTVFLSILELWDINLQFWEEKSKLWDINSQLWEKDSEM